MDNKEYHRSTKPYIVRAIYRWSLDNSFTPQILVDTATKSIDIPEQFVKEDRMLLNVHPNAVRSLELENTFVRFATRFSGQEHVVYLPMESILAIFTRENSKGVVFQKEGDSPYEPDPDAPTGAHAGDAPSESKSSKSRTHHLKRIK